MLLSNQLIRRLSSTFPRVSSLARIAVLKTKGNQSSGNTTLPCSFVQSFKTSALQCKSGQISDETIKKAGKRGPVTWASFALFALAGGGVIAYVRYLKEEKEKAKKRETQRSIGKVALGGPFNLTDHTGKAVSDKDFRGKWMLLYFGFTHCPDICPEELDKMTEVINTVAKSTKEISEELQPLFITVDPERDDVEAVKEYIKDFHPKLIGLTGSKERIMEVTKAYRVYFSAGPADEDNDYIVDHTIIQYLVTPEGEFSDYFGKNKTAEEIAATITNRMLKHSMNK